MKKGLMLALIIAFSLIAKAQDISSLPVVPFPVKTLAATTPFVLYLSGDGGENSFSKSLMAQVNGRGYPAVLFNSQKYFWSKKTPDQTASDVEKVIRHYQAQWMLKNIIIIGYSFGADVAPFVVTRLTGPTYSAVKNIVLMSPSQATDFEVHVAQLFGSGKSTGSSVTEEINKIKTKPLLILQGLEEAEKIESTALKVNYKLIGLQGGHKYDSDTSEVANTIFKNLQ